MFTIDNRICLGHFVRLAPIAPVRPDEYGSHEPLDEVTRQRNRAYENALYRFNLLNGIIGEVVCMETSGDGTPSLIVRIEVNDPSAYQRISLHEIAAIAIHPCRLDIVPHLHL